MLVNVVKELQARKTQIAGQIETLEAEAEKIDQALAALNGLAGGRNVSLLRLRALEKARAARWAKHSSGSAAPKKRRKMSLLGKLRIKLGALNRYGKKEEAKQLAARIAELEAQAAKK